MYSHVSRNHSFMATPTPPPRRPTSSSRANNILAGIPSTLSSPAGTPGPGRSACRIRYTASIKNGNPNPSLAPASDEIISRSGRATYLSANGPLAMACERMGSVHVTHDAMTRAARSVTRGTVASTQSVVQSHMMVMMGSRQSAISFQRFRLYLAGSW